MGVIYIAKSASSGGIYIGKTSATLAHRKGQHKSNALGRNKSTHFYNAIRKYGWGDFDWQILQEVSNDSLYSAEQEFIHFYKLLDVKLYNKTDGGAGPCGFKHSEETKNKLRKLSAGNTSHLGHRHSDETRAKIRSARMNQTDPRLGSRHSEETRRKISESRRGK